MYRTGNHQRAAEFVQRTSSESNMEEIGKAQQKVIARLIREWISSDANRRQLRQLLDLPTDADMPSEHRSLLDELDRKLNQ
ncbi:hypothetical protein X769_05565 [Mesorhizobium sp. LSJC268A00]|nr:hypothetical protein X771_00800 [Mesorhizobium sp. LSJC277A00]ESW89137.1 hypothetical protein X773_03105 [Mesorhizobium sp. LSJC285A00]ESX07184.1 hypothetical protein X769_05565 [Mesorhizobium sp. LSJC268A00]ESY28076.1 hypothetical protein X749_19815 [Mesorhizobium sp. LNJC391B00]ESZ45327.1 hypothetical protein X731_18935 [Mesorhizobium sp. L2C054A000]ESZ59564.1 hypothetical protein X728_17510 [Mesorhizobium sp. L103C120A0]